MISAAIGPMLNNSARRFVDGVLLGLQQSPPALLQLVFRFSIAAVFWKSGHSEIASRDTTILLFTNEYHVPISSPEVGDAYSASIELG